MVVLVIEDCIDTYLLIKNSLQPIEILHASRISEAKDLLDKHRPHLILIDVDLPDGNGVDFCSELSTDPKNSEIPRIILTAKSETADKIYGLYSGADDYITKPFSQQELKARCEIKLKKTTKPSTTAVGPFVFNLEFQKVSLANKGTNSVLDLTPTEFRLLYTLASKEGMALSRHDIVRKVWNENGSSIELRGLDTHISHLRKKLGRFSGCVVSVYGKGYSFDSSKNSDARA